MKTEEFNVDILLWWIPSFVDADGAAINTMRTRAISAPIDNRLVHDNELKSFSKHKGRMINIDMRAIVIFLLANRLSGKNNCATNGIVSPITTKYATWAP